MSLLAFTEPSLWTVLVPICLALVIDLLVGDPPNRFHPVAWMGTALTWGCRWAPQQGRWLPLAYGTGLVVGGVALVMGIGLIVDRLLALCPSVLSWVLEALILKTTLSLRGLASASNHVQTALMAGDLPQARHLLSWHLVSRDTSPLTASQVAAATIESVAENTSDGIVAPLFFYALGGLPLALAYRFLNTADAMMGYRTPRYEWLGKSPARLDDLANLIPARLTAACLVLAALFLGADARRAWLVWCRDARRTASPNAGHPMSAMAGALQVELVKIGVYALGGGQLPPTAQDIARARRLMYGAVVLALALLLILMGFAAPDGTFV